MQRLQLVVILDWIAATPANCLGPAPRTPPDQLQRPAWHKWSLKDWLLNQANMFSGEDPLPQNWVRVLSRGTGQMYYANVETRVAQSEKPPSVTLCHQGFLGRQQSHPPLPGSVHAGSENNTEVGQCLGSFEALALQVRDKAVCRARGQSSSTASRQCVMLMRRKTGHHTVYWCHAPR